MSSALGILLALLSLCLAIITVDGPIFVFLIPFLVAAGAGQYSPKKFLGALILGRGVRYTIGAGLGYFYGRHVLRFFNHYYKPAMAILIGLAVLGAVLSLVQYLRMRKK